MTTRLEALGDWVAEVAELTQPDQIYWCTGTQDEYQTLVQEMLASGDLLELNQEHYPDCYLHRSDPQDVARVEHLTYVCSENEPDAGPNNNWMEPAAAKAKMLELFAGCMQGRTLYVVPYCMGPT
jgi:phosphoenolpyruvate carboxykinase (GTP)